MTKNRIGIVGITVLLVFVSATAQPPGEVSPSQLPQLELPDFSGDVPLPSEATPETKAKIRDALRGDLVPGGSGDPALDDVLQIIRSRGSILDGTSLAESDPDPAVAPSCADRDFAIVAESLLRTARLLEGIALGNSDRSQLVSKMRAEAAAILIQD